VHVQHDRTEASNLMFARHGAALPGRGGPRSAVVTEHQTLVFPILERQRQSAVDLGDFADMAACPLQTGMPILEAVLAGDAQAGARDRVGAAAFGRRRKIEKGEIGAGIGFPVGVEQVICADVVLINGLLHQPHAQKAGVERQILARFR
jgi:hypothetical protein